MKQCQACGQLFTWQNKRVRPLIKSSVCADAHKGPFPFLAANKRPEAQAKNTPNDKDDDPHSPLLPKGN